MGRCSYLSVLNFDRKTRVGQRVANPQDEAIVSERLDLEIDGHCIVNFEVRI